MGTLLLRLAAPLQAWGDESKYDIRGTRTEPTKSGVIGMIAAAMGLSRDSLEVQTLANKLRMGVRVDQPGVIIRDFHTARAPKYSNDGSLRYAENGLILMESSPYVTSRFYICDAVFLVGLECSDEGYLESVGAALLAPAFPIFLGRRACPPTLPIYLGIRNSNLENVMQDEEWLASDWYKEKKSCIRARIIMETPSGQKIWYTQMDQPISFNPVQRKHSLRGLDREQYVMLGRPEHDPMTAL